jgi:hypothetical protein
MHQYISPIVKRLISEIFNKLLSSLIDIIGLGFFVINNWLSFFISSKFKSRRWFIMIILHVRKNRSINSTLLKWMHYHFHCLALQSNFFILVINSSEKPSIETHLTENWCLCSLVTKRINLPSYCGSCSKSLLQKSIGIIFL